MNVKIIRESENFILSQRGKQFWLHAKGRNSVPAAMRVSERNKRYLAHGCGHEFDGACVVDFGCGAFQREVKP